MSVLGTELLIVDQDPSLLATQIAFRAFGYVTRTARSLDEAIAIACRYPPQVIVVEWSPRCGVGRGATSKLRAAIPHRVVIIAFSVLEEPAGFTAEESVDAYFTKPTAVEEIHGRIQELFDTT